MVSIILRFDLELECTNNLTYVLCIIMHVCIRLMHMYRDTRKRTHE